MAFGTVAVLTLAAGTAALGAFSSAQQAKAANRFAGRRQEAQIRAARIQATQIEAQSELQKLKTRRMAHQVRSTLRVGAGIRLGEGQSFFALLRQADFDEATRIEIIERNAEAAQERVFSGIQPLPPEQDASLAAILGGLQGAQAGLSLGTSGLRLGQSIPKPERTGGTG